jgi:hypothetical protein
MKHFPTLLLFIFLISSKAIACTCSWKTYSEIKAHNQKANRAVDKIFVLVGKVIQKIPVHGRDAPDISNVKIFHYWGDKNIFVKSDTISIMDDSYCPAHLELDSIYIIKGHFENDVFQTGRCWHNERLTKSSLDSLKILGAGYVVGKIEPQNGERFRIELKDILLGLSMMINAVLFILLLRRKDGS